MRSAVRRAQDQSPYLAGILFEPAGFAEIADAVPATRAHAAVRRCPSGTPGRKRTSVRFCTSPRASRGSRSPIPRRSDSRGSSTAAAFPVRPWRPYRRSAIGRQRQQSPHRRLRSAATRRAIGALRRRAATAAQRGCRFPGTGARTLAGHRPIDALPAHVRPPVAGPVARSRRCRRSCRPRCKKYPSGFSFQAFQAPVGKGADCPHKLPRAEEPTAIILHATIATRQ
ncbi:hypothetical protein D3C87_965790 [compost metagenome]